MGRNRFARGLAVMPADRTIALEFLNALDINAFTAVLGGIFEHSAWIGHAAYPGRPFGSVSALHEAMVSVVENATAERQLALLRAHPELAQTGPLTAASLAEQGGMGLDRLASDEAAAPSTHSTPHTAPGLAFRLL